MGGLTLLRSSQIICGAAIVAVCALTWATGHPETDGLDTSATIALSLGTVAASTAALLFHRQLQASRARLCALLELAFSSTSSIAFLLLAAGLHPPTGSIRLQPAAAASLASHATSPNQHTQPAAFSSKTSSSSSLLGSGIVANAQGPARARRLLLSVLPAAQQAAAASPCSSRRQRWNSHDRRHHHPQSLLQPSLPQQHQPQRHQHHQADDVEVHHSAVAIESAVAAAMWMDAGTLSTADYELTTGLHEPQQFHHHRHLLGMQQQQQQQRQLPAEQADSSTSSSGGGSLDEQSRQQGSGAALQAAVSGLCLLTGLLHAVRVLLVLRGLMSRQTAGTSHGLDAHSEPFLVG